jgi:hypothetical protein
MAGTQFIGKDAILGVYNDEYAGYPWALFQGKKKRAEGDSAAELEKWIDRFSPAGSTATYTLVVYDENGNDEVANWDFKINTYNGGNNGSGGAIGKLQQMFETDFLNRLHAVEKKMNEQPDDEEGFDLNKIIMDYLENPHKLAQVGGFLKSIFGGAQAPAAAPAAIGSVPPSPQAGGFVQNGNDEEVQRLAVAINRLHAQYPNLVPCLEKLADIAEKDPLTWGMIKSKLDAL